MSKDTQRDHSNAVRSNRDDLTDRELEHASGGYGGARAVYLKIEMENVSAPDDAKFTAEGGHE